jgi:hypothetical protein
MRVIGLGDDLSTGRVRGGQAGVREDRRPVPVPVAGHREGVSSTGRRDTGIGTALQIAGTVATGVLLADNRQKPAK